MLNINPKYENDILQYCKLNNIEDVDLFVTQCFKQGFDIKKYGFLGGSDIPEEKIIEKEIIVEKEIIKEVPVEVKVIEYVDREVIKEVFVEVPKEKIVTKIEYISDKTNENELVYKIHELENTISNLNNEMSKKDENLDELRRNLDEALDKPPVEVIKEVEVIREVEKPNDKAKMLSETLMKLKSQLSEKDGEIEKLNNTIKQLESRLNPTGAIYMKGSNINENL